MDNPKVSIVIPTFNAADTLESAISSIFNQTYKNIEVVIVDGKSTDGTLDIVNRYKEKLPLIVISEPDKGIYDAMNKGIQVSTGAWLYFLGSDDTLLNQDILTTIFGDPEHLKYDVLYGNVLLKKRNVLYDGVFDLQKLTYRNICHQAVFFKKRVFELVGDFNLKYKTLADYEHNIKWFANEGITKKYVDETIALYSEGGVSSQFIDDQFLMDKIDVFKKVTQKKLDFSSHFHILGSIGVEHVRKRDFIKGYKYVLIALMKMNVRDFQYLKQSFQYTISSKKNKFNGNG
jgi:glycosyltransferase involved in cell wall biosynthesis